MNYIMVFLMVIIIFGLPVWNLARLFGKAHPLWMIAPVALFLASFQAVGFFESIDTAVWYQSLKYFNFYWFIFTMMLFGVSMLGLLGEIMSYSIKQINIPKKAIASAILGITIVYFILAVIFGRVIKTNDVYLSSPKITKEYNFVQISDLHVGSTNKKHADRVVKHIQGLNPDFVVITGDFIDEFHADENDISSFENLAAPTYLITGNHEYYIEPFSLPKVIENSKINLIDHKKVSFEELDIIGVNELESILQTVNDTGINNDRYTIVLDHQPIVEEAAEASKLGADLMLSGHTHKGQIWPTEYLLAFRYKYLAGLYPVGNMFIHVNQGVGTLGPLMRLGTYNEVTHIHLVPENNN
jgi:predicted MPP superfamily phosphohydrolase